MKLTWFRHARKQALGSAFASLVLGFGLASCGGEPPAETPAADAAAGHGEDHRGHDGQGGGPGAGEGDGRGAGSGHGASHGASHGAGHGEGPGAGDGAHHGSSHDARSLRQVLVTANALPEGYRSGSGHQHVAAGAAPTLGPGCAPIAELIGTHPSVRQDVHPQASATFSKGHFGPYVTETVIDYGDAASAERAVERVRRSSEDCDRYVQSTSPIGANVYTVQPSVPGWSGPPGATVRLAAVGDDFAGLHWDIWVTRSGSRLAAVTLRSVAGGSNEDLAPAIAAARAALGG